MSGGLDFHLGDAHHHARIAHVYGRYDADGSGTMDAEELEGALRELKALPRHGDPKAFVASLLESVEHDDDDRSTLTLGEFKKLFDLGKLRQAFAEADEDGSGQITALEIARAMRKLGVRSASLEDAKRLIRRVDASGDGTVDLEEFEAAFEFVPLASLQSIAQTWATLEELPDLCGGELGAATKPVPGLHAWQTVVAGGTAGVLSRTLTAPLERAKLAAQTGLAGGRGLLGLLVDVFKTEGLRGFFAGNLANCLRVFPTGGITCTTYATLLQYTPADDEIDPMEPVYRAGCAGAAACFANALTYPMDVVRARLTVAGGTIASSTRAVAADGGPRAFYRGLGPTLAAVVPFVAVQNATIDLGKAASDDGHAPSKLKLCAIGAAAGVAAQTVTYPLDVLRRRLQIGGLAQDGVVGDRTWLSVAQVIQKEGWRSLFAGIVPTYAKSVPAVAVVATVCVSMNGYFKEQNSIRTVFTRHSTATA